MKIRRGQKLQMLASDDVLLLKGIKTLVREDHAYVVEGLPEDLLDEMIGSGRKTARGFGLTRPEDVSAFVMVQFESGPEFYRHPAVWQILNDATIPPEEKLSVLFDQTSPEVWDEM